MSRPLSLAQVYPAWCPDVRARSLALRTGVRLRIAEGGPAGGAPVVMLPGWCASLYSFRQAFSALATCGCRAIGVDVRGFGLSDKPAQPGAYTLDAYCADLDALLDALELDRCSLVGHSMGGGLALHYALRRGRRVDRLVLINPTGLVDLAYLGLLRVLPRSMAAALGGVLIPRWMVGLILRNLAFADPSRVSERDVDEYWAPTQVRGFVYAARATVSEFDWSRVDDASVARLAIPTVVILGRDDRLVPNATDAAERLHATVYRLRGGHCVHEERPDEVYARIAGFLRSVG